MRKAFPPPEHTARAKPRFQRVWALAALALSFALAAAPACDADPLDFTVSTLGQGLPEVLIIGGIQGDEPGGFSAAALLATQYTFTQGTVHVVPNLNFPAIIRRSRGLHGDMNRKFATLSPRDPEYGTVCRIQSIITQPQVKLVLNLHDGSGFYRPTRESPARNPQRWGQSIIIDQVEWPGIAYGKLEQIAQSVADDANHRLLRQDHAFHVRNTKTSTDDREMAQSLTWFALNHGKSAFGLEVSKEFGVSERAYYHLCMVEAFLRQAGIGFERSFPLSTEGIAKALSSEVYIGFVNNRVILPLENARRQQMGSLPLPRGAERSISATMPIVAVTAERGRLNVHYGNNMVTSFLPDWSETDDNLSSVMVRVDGVVREVSFGQSVPVAESFLVQGVPDYRVNAIGAQLGRDESDMLIRRKDFMENYSVDQAGTTYRVEIYRDKLYCGTFLVKFAPATLTVDSAPVLPSINGVESELGW